MSCDDRLRLWKNLRTDLVNLSLEEQLKEIAKFYALMPFGTRMLDYHDPSAWPTPWEILFHGSFCRSSISLLMFYTLVLLNVNEHIDLELIDDGNDVYLVLVVGYTGTQDHFVLNYHLGEVSIYSDVATEFSSLKVFHKEEIKIIT